MYIKRTSTPGWVKGKTIYEVNIRQYTQEGTFIAFQKHLPRLKNLGIEIIWFMPIYPIGKKNRKGSLGSYYAINNYTAVNPEFGSIEEFITLVDEIHALGMKVIIDWVANHTAWDHHWSKEHSEFYEKDSSGTFKPPVKDWEDVIKLNYDNKDLWESMINEMVFWIKETNIDGFRCDMAHLVPTSFWNYARMKLSQVKDIYMLAESENHDLLQFAFDTIYNWKLLHAMNQLASGKIVARELQNIALNELCYLPDGASFLNFTSNHDENSWQGSAKERLGRYLMPLTVLTFLLPGNPLIYSGQEAGIEKRVSFFDKDLIEWKKDKMYELIQKLNSIKKDWNPLSYSGMKKMTDNNKDDILALRDDQNEYILLINFSNSEKKTFNLHDFLEKDYLEVFSDQIHSFSSKKNITLKPLKYNAFRLIN